MATTKTISREAARAANQAARDRLSVDPIALTREALRADTRSRFDQLRADFAARGKTDRAMDIERLLNVLGTAATAVAQGTDILRLADVAEMASQLSPESVATPVGTNVETLPDRPPEPTLVVFGPRHEILAERMCFLLDATAVGGGRTALSFIAERVPLLTDAFRPVNRASLPRLHLVTTAEADTMPGGAAFLPGLGTSDQSASVPQLTLPGFEPAVGGCPSWLLWLYDQAGGESLSQGRGAPWALRLFVGVLLHVSVPDRDGSWRSLQFDTDEVTRWLHPSGWSNRRRDWSRLPAALEAMRQIAYVPVPGIGSVAILFPSVIPRLPSDPLVEFTARIPLSAARGARIDWPRLKRYGADSAALYRAYLSVCAAMDSVAFKGAPITRRIGAPVFAADGQPKRRKGGAILRRSDVLVEHPRAAMAPEWTDADAARFIGFDPTDRFRRRDARRALERLAADGVIDLDPVSRGKLRLFGPR